MENSTKTSFLTASETKVVELLIRGYSEKEIAEKLHISPHTVNNHMRNIRSRNGLSKNTEIIACYIAYLRGNKFDLHLLREYGISIFFVLLNVCDLGRLS